MKRLLLFILLASPFASTGQQRTPIGVDNGYIQLKGATKTDTIFVLPVRDTIGWNDATFQKLGRLTIRPQDKRPYYHNGTRWLRMLDQTDGTGGGSGTTYYAGFAITISDGDTIKVDSSVMATKSYVTALLAGYYTKTQVDTLLAGKSDVGHTHSQYIGKTDNFGAVSARVSADSNAFTFGDATFIQPYSVNIYGGAYAALSFKSDLNFLGMSPRSATPTADGVNLGTWQVNKMTTTGLNSGGSINFIAAGGSSSRFTYIDILTANNRSAFIGREGIRGHSFTSGSIGMISIGSSSENGLFFANPQAGYGYPLYHGIKSVGSSQPLFKLDSDNGQNLTLIDKDGYLSTTDVLADKGTHFVDTSYYVVNDTDRHLYINTALHSTTLFFDTSLKKKVVYIKNTGTHTTTLTTNGTFDGDGSITIGDKREVRVHHATRTSFYTNNLPTAQETDHVHGEDFGEIADVTRGFFNTKAGNDTITTLLPLFAPNSEGKAISIAGVRDNSAFRDSLDYMDCYIKKYVNPYTVVLDTLLDATRSNRTGYFGTNNYDYEMDAVKYCEAIGIGRIEHNGVGLYGWWPQLSERRDTGTIPLRKPITISYLPCNGVKLGVNSVNNVDTTKDYNFAMYTLYSAGNYLFENPTFICSDDYTQNNTGGPVAIKYAHGLTNITGQCILLNPTFIGDSASGNPDWDIQWGAAYENVARVGVTGGKHATVIRNGIFQTNVGAVSIFDDTTGKSYYPDMLTTYNGGSRRMAEDIGAHANISSGSHILTITGLPNHTWYKHRSGYPEDDRKPTIRIKYGSDTLTTVVDSIVSKHVAYLHDAAPADITDGYASTKTTQGENHYIDNSVDIIAKWVLQINPYKWGWHTYSTEGKPDARIREYWWCQTRFENMMYGVVSPGDLIGRHATPIIKMRGCVLPFNPYNQPLNVDAEDCEFTLDETINRGLLSVYKRCKFNKFFQYAMDTVGLFDCTAESVHTGLYCYLKVNHGVVKNITGDIRTQFNGTLDSNGHPFNTNLATGADTNYIRFINAKGQELKGNTLASYLSGKIDSLTKSNDTLYSWKNGAKSFVCVITAGAGSGNTILNGSGAPSSGIGSNGDYYIDNTAHDIYGPKTVGAWGAGTSLIGPAGADGAAGAPGADGADGAPGADGADGAPGVDGKTVLNGSGAPSGGTGNDGDFYINTTTFEIYGPKTAGSWGSGTSLVGPTGSTGATGATGATGSAGTNGTDGKTIRNGSGAPSGGLGVDGDFYLNTANYDFYGPKASGLWGSPTSLVGPTGATGATGAAGSTGAAGADGKTVRSGSGTPSGGLGVDGDFYINTAANTIYGPKTSGSWGSPTSIVGPTGATGSNGTDGKTVLNGSGAPSGGTGNNGDFYLNTTNYDFYGPKTGGSWGSPVSLKYNITPQTLTSGTSITYDIANGVNAYLALGHNATITMSKTGGSVVAGETGVLTVKMNSPGAYTLAVPNGTVTLNSNTGDTTTIAWYYNGTNYVWRDGNATAINTSTGTYIGRQVLTSGTTYTPTAGTKTIVVKMLGAGGGGGGTTGGSSQLGAGGGGGAGGYLEKLITNVSGTYTYSIGTAGTAGTTGPTAGGSGGNTTFTNGATTYTANGGSGGTQQSTGTSAAMIAGGAGGAVSTNGDVNGGGAPGERGYRVSGTVGYSGNGGYTMFGGGGAGQTSSAVGGTATGYGAGGGGGLSTSTTNRAGGAGAPGLIIIEEYK